MLARQVLVDLAEEACTRGDLEIFSPYEFVRLPPPCVHLPMITDLIDLV
jgi:hypothetical protein